MTTILLVATLAACGTETDVSDDRPATDPRAVVVEGTELIGRALPLVDWWPDPPNGSTTTTAPWKPRLRGWLTLLYVTGDPIGVFDRLATELELGPQATATRACVVHEGEHDRLLREPARPGPAAITCSVGNDTERVEVRYPAGRVCVGTRRSSASCPIVGTAWVERPLQPDPWPAWFTESELLWLEVIEPTGPGPLAEVPDRLVREVHRPDFSAADPAMWAEPGEPLRRGDDYDLASLPPDVEVLTPTLYFRDCEGAVVTSTEAASQVLAEFSGPDAYVMSTVEGSETFAQGQNMAQWSLGIGDPSGSTALLRSGCPD